MSKLEIGLAIAFALSEYLGGNPKIKESAVYQLCAKVLKVIPFIIRRK